MLKPDYDTHLQPLFLAIIRLSKSIKHDANDYSNKKVELYNYLVTQKNMDLHCKDSQPVCRETMPGVSQHFQK